MASTACVSKLQLQTHFGDKPCEYCMEVLVLTTFSLLWQSTGSQTQRSYSSLAYFQTLGAMSAQGCLPACVPLGTWLAVWSGWMGWAPWAATGTLCSAGGFPIAVCPRAPRHTAAAAPCYEMAQELTGVPETLCQDCGPHGRKFPEKWGRIVVQICLISRRRGAVADSSNGIGAPTFHHPLSYGSFGEGKRDYTCIAEEYCIGLFSNCAEQDF